MEQGFDKVGEVDKAVGNAAGLVAFGCEVFPFLREVGDEGHPGAGVIEIALGADHDPAVVGDIEDDGVVRLSVLLESLPEVADTLVHFFNRGIDLSPVISGGLVFDLVGGYVERVPELFDGVIHLLLVEGVHAKGA